MRTALKYSAVLIGVYLAVSYATGAGRLLTSGGAAGAGLVKAFQGR